mmetsp:Transcript_6598/g.11601  ORF Transcript_6598/g.11601 Transcript_6598/m.11601 type:complete len:207 (+) Transcript_6598:1645-2265(+)
MVGRREEDTLHGRPRHGAQLGIDHGVRVAHPVLLLHVLRHGVDAPSQSGHGALQGQVRGGLGQIHEGGALHFHPVRVLEQTGFFSWWDVLLGVSFRLGFTMSNDVNGCSVPMSVKVSSGKMVCLYMSMFLWGVGYIYLNVGCTDLAFLTWEKPFRSGEGLGCVQKSPFSQVEVHRRQYSDSEGKWTTGERTHLLSVRRKEKTNCFF